MLSPLARRFRTVVAMWIFVGFAGAPFFFMFGVMALTATGPYQYKESFEVEAEFAPGEEVATSVLGMDDVLVVAQPRTVDLADVTCQSKSRVYSTGEQDVDDVLPERPEGVEPVLRSREPAPREFVPVVLLDWMGTSYVTCTGGGAESFAITSGDGVHTDAFRYGSAAVAVVMSVVAGIGGCLALHFTRKWNRDAGLAQYAYQHGGPWGQYGGQPYPPQQPWGPQAPGQQPHPPQQPWGPQAPEQAPGQPGHGQHPQPPDPATADPRDPYTPPPPR